MKTTIRNAIAGVLFASAASTCSASVAPIPPDLSESTSDKQTMSLLRNPSYSKYSEEQPIAVTLVNPCYPKYSEEKSISVTNGSMLSFASSGGVGKTIRAASAMNDVPNPLGLTHSGVAINEDPAILHRTVLELMPRSDNKVVSELTYESGKAMLDELEEIYHDQIAATSTTLMLKPFSLESDGSAGEVLRGVLPHVHFHDLGTRLSQYDGNVFIRPLHVNVSLDYSRKFIREYLGRPYESVTALGELINSIRGGNDVEGRDRVFCSELAGYFYEGAGIIPEEVNISNILPEHFGTAAGKDDFLARHAGPEITLKQMYRFSDEDLSGNSCFGRRVQRFIRLFQCCK